MPAEDVDRFEAVAGELLDELGYGRGEGTAVDPAAPAVPRPDRCRRGQPVVDPGGGGRSRPRPLADAPVVTSVPSPSVLPALWPDLDATIANSETGCAPIEALGAQEYGLARGAEARPPRVHHPGRDGRTGCCGRGRTPPRGRGRRRRRPCPRARWSNPATWGGRVPTRGDVVRIDKPVLLDVNAEVAGVRIGVRGSLVFDPARNQRLASHGNIVVRRSPRDAAVRPPRRSPDRLRRHRRTPLPWRTRAGPRSRPTSDSGSSATACSTAMAPRRHRGPDLARAAQAGQRAITVVDADRMARRRRDRDHSDPAADRPEHWTHHDRRRITAISGRTIRLDRPLDLPAPGGQGAARCRSIGPRSSTSPATWSSPERPRAGPT